VNVQPSNFICQSRIIQYLYIHFSAGADSCGFHTFPESGQILQNINLS